MQGIKPTQATSVRMPPDINKWVRHKAVDDDRSLSSVIVQILKKAKKEDEKSEKSV